MKPICYDLYCGLGGWSEAFLAEGYRCIGYDIEAHDYGSGGYPGELILRDVTTIHGSQFKDAAMIVASPPCQDYSYMAMPWKRAKAKAAAIRADTTGVELERLNRLFNACFRIQREACEASGKHIPMIVENVRGAQGWVGQARWHYGSFYLWGDVPAIMPKPESRKLKTVGAPTASQVVNHNCHINEMRDGLKVGGTNLRKVGFNVAAVRKMLHGDPNMTNEQGRKGQALGSSSWQNKEERHPLGTRKFWSGSTQRKMASAMIAKIPYPLAEHIARTYYPQTANPSPK